VTTIRFFGDINSDGNVNYIEYQYDGTNSQITRSMTPITQTNKSAALPLVRNVTPGSAQFVLNTDSMGAITSVTLSMTVKNNWKTGSKYQETELSSRIAIPSTAAGSALLSENRTYGGINRLPPTPAQVSTWANYYAQ
jgi:hypothetical protein